MMAKDGASAPGDAPSFVEKGGLRFLLQVLLWAVVIAVNQIFLNDDGNSRGEPANEHSDCWGYVAANCEPAVSCIQMAPSQASRATPRSTQEAGPARVLQVVVLRKATQRGPEARCNERSTAAESDIFPSDEPLEGLLDNVGGVVGPGGRTGY